MTTEHHQANAPTRFETRAEFERALHGLGIPRSAAKKLVAGGWPALSREPVEEPRRPQKGIDEMSIQDLRELRASKCEQANALAAKKNFSASIDQPALDALMAEVEEIDGRMNRIAAVNERAVADMMKATVSVNGDTESWQTDAGKAPVMNKHSNFKAIYKAAARNDEPVSMGDFLRAIAGGKATPGVRAALSEGTDSAGGYTVPTILMPQILQALVPASSLLQAGAGIVDVSQSGAKSYNTAAISSIPTAAWRSEAGSVSESDPVFRNVQATPRSLAFFFKLSRELLADGTNLEQALTTAIAQAFAVELDRVGLRGTGTPPEPRGILNTSGIQSVTNGAAGASLGTTAYSNLISAVQKLLEANAPLPSAFIMSPRSLTTLGGLLDLQDQPRRVPPIIADIPFIATSQIPNNLTVTTSSDCSEIYAGKFDSLKFVMRERPSILLADQAFASTGQVGFFCHVRADVAIEYPAAFAVVTGVRA
jgi:HK97 family phage major capsid protein